MLSDVGKIAVMIVIGTHTSTHKHIDNRPINRRQIGRLKTELVGKTTCSKIQFVVGVECDIVIYTIKKDASMQRRLPKTKEGRCQNGDCEEEPLHG